MVFWSWSKKKLRFHNFYGVGVGVRTKFVGLKLVEGVSKSSQRVESKIVIGFQIWARFDWENGETRCVVSSDHYCSYEITLWNDESPPIHFCFFYLFQDFLKSVRNIYFNLCKGLDWGGKVGRVDSNEQSDVVEGSGLFQLIWD